MYTTMTDWFTAQVNVC